MRRVRQAGCGVRAAHCATGSSSVANVSAGAVAAASRSSGSQQSMTWYVTPTAGIESVGTRTPAVK